MVIAPTDSGCRAVDRSYVGRLVPQHTKLVWLVRVALDAIVRPRGSKVDRVEVAREIATAIGHMLTNNEPFARQARL